MRENNTEMKKRCDICNTPLFEDDYNWNGGLCDKCKYTVKSEIEAENERSPK